MAPPQTPEHRYNDRIRAREVRLIGSDGAQLGIKALPEALSLARSLDLDLVEVAPMANPPVCRIMDYGKFRYEESQKAKESRKKTVQVSIKEVKFRPKIGKGDFDTKVRHMQDFLQDGHKVKVTLQFRGREMAHPELGSKILDSVIEQLGPLAKVEAYARLEGRNMTMVLAPEKKIAPKKEREHREPKPASSESAESAESAETPAASEPSEPTETPAAESAPAPEPATAADPAPAAD
ncbi:MAG: translation initiation factor IF-3 [Actinobacteria bacterium]|nr:translation initiation factor IF-3 [Actinomycetota bacterium]